MLLLKVLDNLMPCVWTSQVKVVTIDKSLFFTQVCSQTFNLSVVIQRNSNLV